MASKKSDKIRRETYRHNVKLEFLDKMNNLVVISSILKERIIGAYMQSETRLATLKITTDNWSKIDGWREYSDLEKEIKLLGIFSQEFYSIIYNGFYMLQHTYNPHADFNDI